MKLLYRKLQHQFEKVSNAATAVLASSITFTVALGMVIFWFANRDYKTQSVNETIGNLIVSVSFLSLFIIQKMFNHFAASLHVKLNELIISHKPANNAIANVEKKTEHEIAEIKELYAELIEEKNNS